MLADMTISGEMVTFFTALAGVAFASMLTALGWLVLRVATLSESIARIVQKLEDLPCDKCP